MSSIKPEQFSEIDELAHRRLDIGTKLASLILNHENHREWFSRRLLFVTGPHASGKSTAAHHALEGVCGIHDLGPIIRDTHNQEAEDIPFVEWLGRGEREVGPDFTNDILVQHLRPKLEAPQAAGTVLVGSRSVRGIKHLVKHLLPSTHKVIYLEVSDDVLYNRFRGRPKSASSSEEQFKTALQTEHEMGLGLVKNFADHIIRNDGALETVVHELQEIVLSWQPEAD